VTEKDFWQLVAWPAAAEPPRKFEKWRAQTKGQSTGGCESRPGKPPEEPGSEFSGVG